MNKLKEPAIFVTIAIILALVAFMYLPYLFGETTYWIEYNGEKTSVPVSKYLYELTADQQEIVTEQLEPNLTAGIIGSIMAFGVSIFLFRKRIF